MYRYESGIGCAGRGVCEGIHGGWTAGHREPTQLREYAARQGYTVVHEYVDQASGKGSERDAFKQREFARVPEHVLDVLRKDARDRARRFRWVGITAV